MCVSVCVRERMPMRGSSHVDEGSNIEETDDHTLKSMSPVHSCDENSDHSDINAAPSVRLCPAEIPGSTRDTSHT